MVTCGISRLASSKLDMRHPSYSALPPPSMIYDEHSFIIPDGTRLDFGDIESETCLEAVEDDVNTRFTVSARGFLAESNSVRA